MERQYTEILHDYQTADHTRRLNLYMRFPDLRPQFLEIDLDDPVTAPKPSWWIVTLLGSIVSKIRGV